MFSMGNYLVIIICKIPKMQAPTHTDITRFLSDFLEASFVSSLLTFSGSRCSFRKNRPDPKMGQISFRIILEEEMHLEILSKRIPRLIRLGKNTRPKNIRDS